MWTTCWTLMTKGVMAPNKEYNRPEQRIEYLSRNSHELDMNFVPQNLRQVNDIT